MGSYFREVHDKLGSQNTRIAVFLDGPHEVKVELPWYCHAHFTNEEGGVVRSDLFTAGKTGGSQ